MISQQKELPRPSAEENEDAVGRWFERMLKEAMEFGEMIHRNQTESYLDRKKPRDDWNVDNR